MRIGVAWFSDAQFGDGLPDSSSLGIDSSDQRPKQTDCLRSGCLGGKAAFLIAWNRLPYRICEIHEAPEFVLEYLDGLMRAFREAAHRIDLRRASLISHLLLILLDRLAAER
ncbi:hypothetical protein WJ85_17245 [Burkholderia ubonensis]|nr:hypothetical protein WJ85_17245 [Burkholderia ubonensis]